MSKLKLPVSYFAPLCLKIQGRIVGAVSRMSMAIYIALGLLIVSSVLLTILLANINKEPIADIKSDKKVESQAAEIIQVQPTAIAVPQVIPEPTAKVISKEEPNDDVIAISAAMRGPIQLDFGWQFHDVYSDWRYHTGIDISGSVGQSVEAIQNGQVIDIFRDKHSGLTVVVKNKTYSVYYGSLSEAAVSKGSQVRPGQKIGIMGSCAGEQYNHVHLAIAKGEKYIDPKLIMNEN
ncbi:MAG: M23 family metallopeptidase [Sporomusaceae bacterium]|nr:M23 family metallopeptidase [Sporomusaceae bacterium]